MNSVPSLIQRLSQFKISTDKDASFWVVNLEKIPIEEAEAALTMLDNEEQSRCRSYLFESDRRCSAVLHALLKQILSELIDNRGDQLQILRNCYGKPYLAGHPLYFNLSRSEGRALIGIHSFRNLGVDIEKFPSKIDLLECLDSFLFPEEKMWAFNGSGTFQEKALSLWCAKEALLKMLGTGFSTGSIPLIVMETCPEGYIGKAVFPESKNSQTHQVMVYRSLLPDYRMAVSFDIIKLS